MITATIGGPLSTSDRETFARELNGKIRSEFGGQILATEQILRLLNDAEALQRPFAFMPTPADTDKRCTAVTSICERLGIPFRIEQERTRTIHDGIKAANVEVGENNKPVAVRLHIDWFLDDRYDPRRLRPLLRNLVTKPWIPVLRSDTVRDRTIAQKTLDRWRGTKTLRNVRGAQEGPVEQAADAAA